VHGSAPDIAGRKIAIDRRHLVGRADARAPRARGRRPAAVVRAIERVIVEGPHTADMKGRASTMEVGAAVADAARGESKKQAA